MATATTKARHPSAQKSAPAPASPVQAAPPATSGSVPGIVDVNQLYTLTEACRRLRWGKYALRTARKRGLRIAKVGRQKYLSGAEVVRFVEAQAANQAAMEKCTPL